MIFDVPCLTDAEAAALVLLLRGPMAARGWFEVIASVGVAADLMAKGCITAERTPDGPPGAARMTLTPLGTLAVASHKGDGGAKVAGMKRFLGGMP